MKKPAITCLLLSLYFLPHLFADVLKVDGISIYYEVRGQGPALVFLHGGFGDLRMWNDQVDFFARNFRVIRYDQPGFGKSTKPESEYSAAAVLLKLLDHLEIQKANLAGNSMGGTLAIDFAILHPDRVSSLVIVGSGADGYPIPKEDQDRMNAVFATAAQKGLPQAVELWLTNPMVAAAMSQPSSKELLEQMVNDNAGIFLMRFWPLEKMNPPGLQRLKEIQAPMLLVMGNKDTPIIHAIADATAAGIPGTKIITLEGTDHLPQMEKPAEFNQIVSEFLKQQ